MVDCSGGERKAEEGRAERGEGEFKVAGGRFEDEGRREEGVER